MPGRARGEDKGKGRPLKPLKCWSQARLLRVISKLRVSGELWPDFLVARFTISVIVKKQWSQRDESKELFKKARSTHLLFWSIAICSGGASYMTTSINQRGELVFPKSIRASCRIRPGDGFEVIADEDDFDLILLRRIRPAANAGLVKHLMACHYKGRLVARRAVWD